MRIDRYLRLGHILQEDVLVLLTVVLDNNKSSSFCSHSKYVNVVAVSRASVIAIACSCCFLVRLIRVFGSRSYGSLF